MKSILKNIIRVTSIALLSSSSLFSINLYADDTEIYTGATSGGFEEQIRPNVLYVLDTSGSMKKKPGFFIDPADFWGESYNPDTIYPGSCDPDMVYRRNADLDGSGNHFVGSHGYPINEPDDPTDLTADELADFNFQGCTSDNYFPKTTLHCKHAMDALNDPDRGWYADKVVEKVPGNSSWYSPHFSRNVRTDVLRECADDNGNHGHNSDVSGAVYIIHDPDNWTSDPAHPDRFDVDSYGNGREIVMADGNFLNWFNAVPQSRIAAVKIAMRDVIADLPDDVNVGLMRFDTGNDDNSPYSKSNTQGGYMFHEFVRVGDGTNRQSLMDAVMNIENETDGGTPLGEAMTEAAYVFAGGPVYWGTISTDKNGYPSPSVAESRKNTDPASADHKLYDSPIDYSCQPNSTIFFTDGAASGDHDADNGYYSSFDSGLGLMNPWDDTVPFEGGFDGFPDNQDYLVDEDNDGDIDDCGSGSFLSCMARVAHWMANNDVNKNVPGDQFVKTSTIGFLPAGADDTPETLPDPVFLQGVADLGGGDFFAVTGFDELVDAFRVTTRQAVSANTAFAAPALAVNAFNRTQDGNRIYFALFKTATTPGWSGNLKAYDLGVQPDGSIAIEDAAGNPAVDPDSGLFHFDARSIWSAVADGNEAVKGGAASNLDDGNRNIYTWINGSHGDSLIASDYAFAAWNSGHVNFTDEMFGLDGTESYTRADLITWLGGVDPTTGTARRHMGDPLHSRPVVVTYGTSDADPDQKIFVTTNDGMLHIIDADNGVEDFAFIAEESLRNAKRMYEGDSSAGKAYGLDGALQLYIDEDGTYEAGISDGDKVYLYAGMRRGGRSYYAFDMTNPASPKILWRITGGDLDNDGTDNEPFHYLGQTFSTPQLGELKIDGNVKKVLIFGGGYDTRQDDPDGTAGTTDDPYVEDDIGNAIYIVDALTGTRLWWASDLADADLIIPEMVNSIPSDVAVLDVDNDGWTDRLYVGDTGGRIFRIDLEEFSSGGLGKIQSTGGMIADIGGSSHATDHPDLATVADNRKLFYAPDIVRVENGDDDYLAVAFGTGNRAHPSYPIIGDTAVEDKFFVLKDPYILNKPSDYGSAYGFTLNDLYDATDNLVMALDADGNPDEDAREAAVDDMNAADGWYIDLEHEGEKALAPAVTLNYKTYFTTFEPLDLDLSTCQARTGIGRLYTIDIRNGKPVNANYYAAVPGDDPDTILETEDRIYELARDGIPPAFTFTFPEAANGSGVGLVATETPPADPGANVQRSYWRTQ